MAIGSPFHEPSWSPSGGLPKTAPVERESRGAGLHVPTEGALDLRLVRAAIQDGLLMVFGPDGDPVPPQVFGAAAAEQPDAGIRLVGGPPLRAERVGAVLDAQSSGQVGAGQVGSEAWVKAMLGIGPQPEMARNEDLLAEACTLDVVAFGRELMITSPNGATFLLADARSPTPDGISLRVAGEGPVALGELVADLLASAGPDHIHPSANEFAAPECKAWLQGDALRIELPEVGTVDLARADDDALAARSVSLFMASGEVATFDDLLSALGRHITPPSAIGYADPLDPALPQRAADARAPRAVPLTIGLPDALAAEPDRVALVVVRGLPEGASLSTGVVSGDGSWLLSPRDVAGLTITAPPDLASDIVLEVAAIAVANPEGELTSVTRTVIVPLQSPPAKPVSSRVVAPAPCPAVEPAPAPPDEPRHASIPLGLDPQALRSGGPLDAVIVRDLPAGVTLSAGTYDPAITGWVLLPHQLSELSVIAASDQSPEFIVTLLGVCLRPGGEERPRVLARVPVIID
jgi:hypothetical protein